MRSTIFTPDSNAHFNRLTGRLVLLLVLSAGLFSCQTITPVPPVAEPTEEQMIAEQQAQAFEQQGLWPEAALQYAQLAETGIPAKQDEYRIKSAQMEIRQDRLLEAADQLNQVDRDKLTERLLNWIAVLDSVIAFEAGKTYQSLANLPDPDQLTDAGFTRIAVITRSRGLLAIGKPLDSVKLLVDSDTLFAEPNEQPLLQTQIWDSLQHMSEPAILRGLSTQQTIPLRGWLELNLIARRSQMLPSRMEPWLRTWKERYSENLLAANYAELLLEQSRSVYINPTRIALLLPLSGKYQAVSEAIQNGFLQAYYQDAQRPDLEIIAISDKPEDFFQSYHQAISNGADMIIGPLDKSLIDQMVINGNLQVPTLSLNYSDMERTTANLFQFGLRPEDEAEQIADIVLDHGLYHALTLTPDTSLGERLKTAFEARFSKLGGQVMAAQTYPSKNNDYSRQIKRMLNLDRSESRHTILGQIIGQSSEFIPRRRQDVDVIFISGNPRQARLIKPQLKFHHALDLPVYATSSISSTEHSTDVDRDLNGILFIDAPWSFKTDTDPDKQTVKSLWPQQVERYGRFFALGVDSYRLIPSLKRLQITQGETLSLNSGRISIDELGRIRRQLQLATFEKGRIVPLETDPQAPRAQK